MKKNLIFLGMIFISFQLYTNTAVNATYTFINKTGYDGTITTQGNTEKTIKNGESVSLSMITMPKPKIAGPVQHYNMTFKANNLTYNDFMYYLINSKITFTIVNGKINMIIS